MFSHLLLSFLGLQVTPDFKSHTTEYLRNYIYSDTYRTCYISNPTFKAFEHPLKCIKDTYIDHSLNFFEPTSITGTSPDNIHFIRKYSFNDLNVSSVTVFSNNKSEVGKIAFTLNEFRNLSQQRQLASYISKINGQPNIKFLHTKFPEYYWHDNQDFKIDLKRDINSNKYVLSVFHKNIEALQLE